MRMRGSIATASPKSMVEARHRLWGSLRILWKNKRKRMRGLIAAVSPKSMAEARHRLWGSLSMTLRVPDFFGSMSFADLILQFEESCRNISESIRIRDLGWS